jgi:hypothetical protein
MYPVCLHADKIRAHYLAANSVKAKTTQRLYALTSSKYEDALQFAHDDPLILKVFICIYMYIYMYIPIYKYSYIYIYI